MHATHTQNSTKVQFDQQELAEYSRTAAVHLIYPHDFSLKIMLPLSISVQEDARILLWWNAEAPPASGLQASVLFENSFGLHRAIMGTWSPDDGRIPRKSISEQQGPGWQVDTDVLKLTLAAEILAVEFEMYSSPMNEDPALKHCGLDIARTNCTLPQAAPLQEAWGRELAVPVRSQLIQPEGKGWCSPTCVGMALQYWAEQKNRPEWNLPTPQIASAVYDSVWQGTGNWSFNAAFAGSLPDMHASLAQLDGIRDLEEMLLRKIPAITSVSYDLLKGKEEAADPGHLITLRGFTADGSLVFNDPAHLPGDPKLWKRIVAREQFLKAWQHSGRLVYCIQPA